MADTADSRGHGHTAIADDDDIAKRSTSEPSRTANKNATSPPPPANNPLNRAETAPEPRPSSEPSRPPAAEKKQPAKRPGPPPKSGTALDRTAGILAGARAGRQPDFGRARPTELQRAITFQLDSDEDEDPTSSDEEWEGEGGEERSGGQGRKVSEREASTGEGSRPGAEDGQKATGRGKRRSKRKSRDWPRFDRFVVGNDAFTSRGRVSKRDGRLKISVSETANRGYLAKALGTGLRNHLKESIREARKGDEGPDQGEADDEEKRRAKDEAEGPAPGPAEAAAAVVPPRLNVVVMVIGSRGDVQPFIRIGRILKEQHGHRVRIATHPAFKDFVERDAGLEFFSVGGDPSELMAFMVKNPGLIPSMETVKQGEIGRRRAAMFEMFQGMWRACINATDDETDRENIKMMGNKAPFVADAIIANPPSFAHVHIAERLGVPLHIMFTFPYSPTTHFPHPLANIKSSNVDSEYTNFMSYPLVEMMTWQGLGDLVNRFRMKTLGLEPVSTLWAPGQLYRLRVPHTYLWSPGLVPKPDDWGPEIDIAGFAFLELASSFEPPPELVKFLEAGEPPVYIGFGSIVVDDPDRFTRMIYEAVRLAGVRALVSKGWGGIGGEGTKPPDNVFLLDNTPHDWLFPRVRAVVHHGGAGTTAIGLKCARPTMIVPFFGDQPFWGSMVARARAGAHECVPYKRLNAQRLADGIEQCLTDEARRNVRRIADSIAREGDGAANAVRSFHRALPLRGEPSLRCAILPDRVAVWQLRNTQLRLSALAAELLVARRQLRWQDLKLLRVYDWNDFDGPGEPITGGGAAVLYSMSQAAKGVGLVPLHMTRSVKERKKHWDKKKRAKKKLKQKEQQEQGSEKDGPVENGDVAAGPPQNGRPTLPARNSTKMSALSADPENYVVEELAYDAGHGLSKTGKAIAKAPMELSLAVAQGFHNAPRLYGDETVRRPVRISGIRSGLRAGKDEFLYGVYDGFTGMAYHPVRGAKTGGALGALTGVGVGVGGLVLKNVAAVLGPAAYAMKGAHRQMRRGRAPTAFVRRARVVQGHKEWRALLEAADGSRALKRSGSVPADGLEVDDKGRGAGAATSSGNARPSSSPSSSSSTTTPASASADLAALTARLAAAAPALAAARAAAAARARLRPRLRHELRARRAHAPAAAAAEAAEAGEAGGTEGRRRPVGDAAGGLGHEDEAEAEVEDLGRGEGWKAEGEERAWGRRGAGGDGDGDGDGGERAAGRRASGPDARDFAPRGAA
ncbi:hypothetical protein BDY21DRAFT_370752 [Lineolata rhizophorae]|uniref:Uncharacterized protein n=1 Tax=Lineolata rhizophorae TaxID=578093 RepID=A0A6A6P3C5_9PEZI|nr:hypothetical protein BDY21DRAFT_370752 [Lineolata rhizophorae]